MLASVHVFCHFCRPGARRVHAAKTEHLLPKALPAGAFPFYRVFAGRVSAFDTSSGSGLHCIDH